MGQSISPSENYLFLNVMVNLVIVNQKLTGSALHIEKNQTIATICLATQLFLFIVDFQQYFCHIECDGYDVENLFGKT